MDGSKLRSRSASGSGSRVIIEPANGQQKTDRDWWLVALTCNDIADFFFDPPNGARTSVPFDGPTHLPWPIMIPKGSQLFFQADDECKVTVLLYGEDPYNSLVKR